MERLNSLIMILLRLPGKLQCMESQSLIPLSD